jgi:hypothetical protein
MVTKINFLLGEQWMALFDGTTLQLGVGFLLAVALAEYAKLRHKSEKGFAWLGVSAAFFLFSAAFAAPAVGLYLGSIAILQQIFELLGWLFALIAVIFVAYESLMEK